MYNGCCWSLPKHTTCRRFCLSLFKFLETREDKQISSYTLVELDEIVLKNSIFEFDEKTFKQKRGTTIGTKFAPPYAILFMADLAEKMLEI